MKVSVRLQHRISIISRLYVSIMRFLTTGGYDEYQRKEYKGKNFRRSIEAVCPEWLYGNFHE